MLKKTCVEIRNINGNISNTNIGVFINDKYSGKKELTSSPLKNSSSVSKLRINIKLKNIMKILIKALIYVLRINWVCDLCHLIEGIIQI